MTSRASNAFRNGSLIALAAGFCVPLMAAGPAAAQDADRAAKAAGVEEVTVTARRREESLKDVPIAVTAYSGEELESLGAYDITYLTQSSPNTTLKVSRGTNSTITAFIRGIGQQDPVAGFEPGVGIYLDDVYLARPQGAVLEIYDVERIEILRGPQGTLYGRNTIGGAVKYVTGRLSDEPQARVKLSVGEFAQTDLLASASGPVNDMLSLGGSVALFKRDGFGKNLFNGKEHYNKDILAGRFTAELTPNDSWFFRLTGDRSVDDSNEKSGHRLTVSNGTMAPVLDNVFDTRAGITGKQEVEQTGGALNVEWTIRDGLVAKSITAYREDRTVSPIDFDSLPANDFDVPVVYDNHQFSQEFQLAFETDNIAGLAGLYFLDANAFDEFDVILGGLGVTSYTYGDIDTSTWAAFADVSFDISETVSASLGGRFTSDERKARVIRQTFLGAGSPRLGNPGAVLLATTGDYTGDRTFDKFTPKASINFKPTDNVNYYASYSQGFKGGSFDPRGNTTVFPGVANGFDQETVDAFEIGAKGNTADRRFSSNVALFYNDYKDIQIPGSVGIDTDGDGQQDDFAGTVTNAGKAGIWGVEFEGNAVFTDRLTGQLAVGYINAEFDEFIVNNVNVANDRVIQNTPEWQGYAGLTWSNDLRLLQQSGEISVNGALSYKSETHQFETPNEFLDQQSYTLLDGSVLWTRDDGKVRLGLHGKNLTDEEYKVAGYFFPVLGLEGVVSAFYGNPRQISATADFRF